MLQTIPLRSTRNMSHLQLASRYWTNLCLRSAIVEAASNPQNMVVVLRVTIDSRYMPWQWFNPHVESPPEMYLLWITLASKKDIWQVSIHAPLTSRLTVMSPAKKRSSDFLLPPGARVYGGPLDWRDRWHRTPLHWAVGISELHTMWKAEVSKVISLRHLHVRTCCFKARLYVSCGVLHFFIVGCFQICIH